MKEKEPLQLKHIVVLIGAIFALWLVWDTYDSIANNPATESDLTEYEAELERIELETQRQIERNRK